MVLERSRLAMNTGHDGTAALINEALSLPTGDDDARYHQIADQLGQRGGSNVLDATRDLCASDDTANMRLGLYILSKLADNGRAADSELLNGVLSVVDRTNDEYTLEGAGFALGHFHAVEQLLRLKNHASDKVRFGVIWGLSHCIVDPAAVSALIELMRDEDACNRDWATFFLGQEPEPDSPAIRQAFIDRLDDEDDVVRGEALRGLAERGDERAIEPLLRELESFEACEYESQSIILEAARALGDPRLIPALRQLDASDNEQIRDAITACEGNRK